MRDAHHAPVLWYSGRSDDPEMARCLSRSLGLPVQVAASPDELLHRLGGPGRPLVLVVGEPERPYPRGGLLRAVKQRASRIPIVYLLGSGDPEDERAVRRAGVHYYAPGPVHMEEVAAVVGRLARRDEGNLSIGGNAA